MKSKLILILTILVFVFPQHASFSQPKTLKRNPASIVNKLKANYSKIKDAEADITLDYNLYLFGCSGRRQLKGKGYYRAPDKIKTVMDGITYFAKGNKIRKIDEKGTKFYVRLIDAMDFGIGFHPGLITHNFNLTTVKDTPNQTIIEGKPKPGIFKHVEKVFFYIDPKNYLLPEINVVFTNKRLPGTIKIDYKKIKGIWVPVAFHGRSAVENYGLLIGLGISLKTENMKINIGLPHKLFDPGF